MHKKKILIDLDGVLNEYIGQFDENFIPVIKSGAKEFLQNLAKDYEVKLFTTRNKSLASNWVRENSLDELITDITNIKEPAYLYIDDRCINFQGDYNELLDKVNNFKVYWKQL